MTAPQSSTWNGKRMTMTRKLWMSLLVATVVSVSGCDDSPGVPDGGLVQPDGARLCTGGETRCDGMCVDTTRDTDHCGACGNVCGTAEACLDGTCTLVCPDGQDVCDGRCVDLQTDEAHCGACGDTCEPGETCSAGACALVCPGDQTECDGSCVSTGSDPENCGACTTTCGAGEVCDMGSCALSCSFGLTECDGACVDLDNNPANCGTCGFTCEAPDGAVGLCASRRCRVACDGAFADCNADLGDASGDGCEIDTDIDADNCGACGVVCGAANAVTGCTTGACTIAMCDTGWADCDMDYTNGCELDVSFDDMNCGACGNVCPAGESCVLSACTGPLAEDCSNAVALSMGANTVGWLATTNDYLTTAPSCTPTFADPDGPDLVMSYTATVDETVDITFDKPTSTRWAASASTAACGTTAPEISCVSEFTAPTLDLPPFSLRAGETAYIYLVDTDSGSNPLDNPLSVNVTTTACASTPTPMVTAQSPMPGSTTATLAPEISVTFDNPISRIVGTVTVSGDMGTSDTYDLSMAPPEISFDTAGTTLTVASRTYNTGERLTVTLSGLESEQCFQPIPTVNWSFSMPVPSCAPGTGGAVGTTTARLATGLSFLTEYYVVADDVPTGWVYFGGTSDFYRIPKAGGAIEDVEALAGLTFTNLGYEAVVVGAEVYTIDSTTSGSGRVYRVTTNGGLTWTTEDYATFATTPADDFRGATAVQALGRIFFVTHEGSSTVDTEIWSVPIGGVAPVAATLERSVPGVQNCSGIAVDNTNYYLACGTRDELVRVPIAAGAPTVISTTIPLNTTKNVVHGQDLDMDGAFDILYVNGADSVYFVCDPGGASPFSSLMLTYSPGTSDYGLGYDRVGNVLYSYDDDTEEVVSIQ